MRCDLCVEELKPCSECKDLILSDIARRAYSKKKYRRSFIDSKMNQCKPCKCCSKIDLALVYRNCPDNMYVNHIKPGNEGGKHCILNIKYCVKQG